MKINKLKRIYGFGKDSKGIIERYFNEEKNWKTHLENTRKFIKDSVSGKQKDLCIVLGSGWCLDIPLEFLSEQFGKVLLFDLVHPSQIIHKYRKLGNIEFLSYDISTVLQPIIDFKKDKKSDNLLSYLKNIKDVSFLEEYNPDYVISANVLSQIAWFPSEYVLKKRLCKKNDLTELKVFTEQKHIDLLPPEKSVLITDYYEYEYNTKGEIINEKTRIHTSLNKEKIIKEWIWDFDLSGNYETGNPVRFKVGALQI